ncbi:Serine threonine protein kinase [Lasiodiplodia theobromae]|uniref:Serine/threonine-protein kinase psk1 n=1 Tax=Lasiodiplodia theobromae TaxID=45133 RepID=A0A5N5DHU9_9PEZI|nr:Serine threonine protein kinase [Lasiodiplodia theobromae]KAB2576592.1 Serine/threonine-protein kinase psk1 [Lasiodiplodia theobromae]KAF4546607.1 Serine threonine protein kinase [Lasiodiplodia theobromae]
MVFAFDEHDQHLPQETAAHHPLSPTHRAAIDGVLNANTPALTVAGPDDELDAEPALRLARNITRSPPMKVMSQSPHRQPSANTGMHAQALGEKLNFEKAKSNAAKKKKKKRANKHTPAPTAMQTIRGFQTPVTSECEETDISASNTPMLGPVKSRDLPSVTSSPALRPSSSSGGISSMKAQLEKLNLSSPIPKSVSTLAASSNVSVISDFSSNSDKTEMDTYQVELNEDFASVEARESVFEEEANGSRFDSLTRKMTADDFEPLRCLGKGSYGTVLLVKHKATGRLFAQKQLRKAHLTVHKKLVEQTKTERVILENVNRHPFVVKLYYAFQDHEKLYLILEYAQGGELFHHLAMERMFTEEVAAFYMAEMVLALEHLHRSVGVVYRDLKPENCLLDSEGHLLLTDFGLSKVAVDENDTCNSMLGTAEYMAPEVIQGREYGFAVDWWSLGALGYDLLTGSPPFTANNNAKVQEKIVKQKLQLPYFLSPDAKDLLTRLLRKEPSKRLGGNMPKDLQTIKAHRFFRKIDWKKLATRELEPPIQPLITDPELAENFAKEFTDLSLSPVMSMRRSIVMIEGMDGAGGTGHAEPDLFGGFSFVASSSLLECGDWAF